MAACTQVSKAPTLPTDATSTIVELPMIQSLRIQDIQPDRSFYRPGETLRLSLRLEAQTERPATVRVMTTVRHLGEVVDTLEEPRAINSGETFVDIAYAPPVTSPRGYGLDVCILAEDGRELACESTAFDVLEHWTQSPRYGFLTDFYPDRKDAEETMAELARYHINGLQFYDWMYRHDQFLTDQDPYLDPLGRRLSRKTIESLIAAANARNIAAMPYTAIYAASVSFYEAHPEWALFQASGEPFRLGDDFLIYMDPRPDSPWMEHLLAQFDCVLAELDFDGIHLDQYGDPKAAQDARGRSFALDEPLAAAVNATKDVVRSRRPDGAVVFNAVNNWPIESVAPSDQDLVYIEVWPPHIWFQDLHDLIVSAQELGDGKPVVLAAYIDPAFQHNARLMDAVIFASGGGHIELGERQGMLADPYFPKYETMSHELAAAMRRYYDFAVRYQEVIGPRTRDATRDYGYRVDLEGYSSNPGMRKNKVWPILREGEGFLAVSLINLLDIPSPEWARGLGAPPAPLGPTEVRIRNVDREVAAIWFATPDSRDLSLQSLDFRRIDEGGTETLAFQIPSLAYWDLILIQWKA